MAGAAPPSRAGRLFAGLGALAVVALIGALPFVLFWAAGNPLAGLGDWFTALSGDPASTLTGVWQTLFTRDDGDLFLHTLALVGWVAAALAAWGWATFLGSFAVELVVQARARRQGRVPRHAKPVRGMRMQQRAAAVLAAAVIGAVVTPTLASASVTLPPTIGTPAAAAVGTHTTPTSSTPAADAGTAAKTGAVTVQRITGSYLEHEVQRGEGLLDIAERYGLSLQRLAEANHGIPQPGGQSLQPSSTRIYAGWTLRIPIAAAGHTTTAATTVTAARQQTPDGDDPATYTVRRGDHLSGISARVLGDPDAYPQLAALNQARIDDPDVIQPGWKLILPAAADDRGARAHATGTVDEPEAAPADQPTGEQDPTTPSTTTPATEEPAAPATVTPTAPSTTAPTPAAENTTVVETPPAAQQPGTAEQNDQDDTAVPAAAAATSIGVLALLALLTLRRRRTRQQQHRRPGRRIAQPADGTNEAKLRIAAAPSDLDRLDTALRQLAAGLAERPDDQWPDAVAAWLEHGTINLVLTTPCPAGPPPPWQPGGDTVWTLPATQPLPPATDQLAPLPTLVALGSQPEQHLLVELERLGMLTLTGDHHRVLDLLRYIAGELAHNHWSDDVYVTLAGFDPGEARLLHRLNPDRITIADTIESAVTKLRRQFDDTRSALDATGTPTTVHGRGTDDSGDAWPPHVLLIADPTPDLQPTLTDLEQLLTTHPSSGFAAVVTGGDQPHGRWPVTVTADGQLHVSFLTDSPLTASALPADMLQPLADLLHAADTLADQPVPPAADTEAWAAGTDAAGGLRDMLDVDEAHDDQDATSEDDEQDRGSATAPAPGDVTPVPVSITSRADNTGPAAWRPVDSVLLTLPTTPPDPAVAARRRHDREERDPHLDADLTAWTGGDLSRPRIAILGPVEIQAPGTTPKNRHRFYAEFVVYLAARGARGATAAQLEDAIWREQDASSSTRRSAISRARTWLGDTADGGKWLPLMAGAEQLYRIADGYLFDWQLFRRLRARGEARGDDGTGDLRQALELVRGAPFAGVQDAYTGDRIAYAWLPDSDIAPTHLVAAIIDTAHQLINLCLAADDITGARWALERAWQADPDRHEAQPWRDAMRIAHADGRDAELKALLHDLMRHVDAADTEDLDPDTYQLVRRLLPYPHRAAS